MPAASQPQRDDSSAAPHATMSGRWSHLTKTKTTAHASAVRAARASAGRSSRRSRRYVSCCSSGHRTSRSAGVRTYCRAAAPPTSAAHAADTRERDVGHAGGASVAARAASSPGRLGVHDASGC
eukprot:3191698-Prymnesium_polylepis.1